MNSVKFCCGGCVHSVLEVPAGSCFVLLAKFMEGAVLEGCLQCLE